MFSKKVFKVFYFVADYNFGDMLNVWLLEALFGIKTTWAPVENCNALCVGSLLHNLPKPKLSLRRKISKFIKSPISVWGTGFINQSPSSYKTLLRKVKVYAVRGKITLDRLHEYKNVKFVHDVLGDPGLLANRLIDVNKVEKKYKLGIIPHYVDKDNSLLKNIQVENSIMIDIQQKPEIVLKQIAECENIISSAMHGLIVADSLGIPNVRMVVSGKLFGGDYKFRDYYSAFDMELPSAVVLSPETIIKDIDFIKQQYQIKPQQVEQICQNLLRVFPCKKRIKK